jgi:pSer/pThr/pTyr-binding forkhead associated (FHA) protein/tetratricopeptide (TPR) repeat protein
MSSVKLVSKANPQTFFETVRESFVLGRSAECEIVLNDPHVSRTQAEVRLKDQKYYIENLGKNRVLVNGQPTKGQFLNDGDEITCGKTTLIFHKGKPDDRSPTETLYQEKTMVFTLSPGKKMVPRIVFTTPSGEVKTYPLGEAQLIIGRSDEVDVYLDDARISRQHCTIEKREDAYIVKHMSATNPTFLNDKPIVEKRLYNGDNLRIGPFNLTFISDRPGDAQPVKERIVTKHKGPGWTYLLLAAALLLSLGAYVAYWHAYRPWQTSQVIEAVSDQIAASDYDSAQDTLKKLLASNLEPEQTQKAKELLAQAALGLTQRLENEGRLKEAKAYLIDYLKDFGSGPEADILWDRLDFYRINLGHRLEASGDYQAAVSQYAAVREASLYADEAQKGVHRIWLAYQQQQREQQHHEPETVSQLLEEADNHYQAKRYLTPVNNNAYSLYQAVLALDSTNAVAQQRIEEIKAFYLKHGSQYFEKKNWKKALTYFERYTFIDPESQDVKRKINTCRDHLDSATPESPKSAGTKTGPDEQRERIKRLLEESGTESSQVMKYLFEEQNGEKDSETPW